MKAYKVYEIKDGTVIDHIPREKALEVLRIIGIQEDHFTTVGINLGSTKYGKKDVIKFENKFLDEKDFDKIALIAPTATFNVIKDSKVVKKTRVKLPNEIIGLAKCSNPNCITNNEYVMTKFKVINEIPLKLKCHYCEKVISNEDIVML